MGSLQTGKPKGRASLVVERVFLAAELRRRSYLLLFGQPAQSHSTLLRGTGAAAGRARLSAVSASSRLGPMFGFQRGRATGPRTPQPEGAPPLMRALSIGSLLRRQVASGEPIEEITAQWIRVRTREVHSIDASDQAGLIRVIKAAFQHADADSSGGLSAAEFTTILGTLLDVVVESAGSDAAASAAALPTPQKGFFANAAERRRRRKLPVISHQVSPSAPALRLSVRPRHGFDTNGPHAGGTRRAGHARRANRGGLGTLQRRRRR